MVKNMSNDRELIDNYYNAIQKRNTVLARNGIHANFFTGYFAKETTKSGTEIYVSCIDENHIDIIKPKLREFLDSQFCEENYPDVA